MSTERPTHPANVTEASNRLGSSDLLGPIVIDRRTAEGLAIRVEDAMKVTQSLLDGAEDATAPDDWKRKTLIIMARDRNRHLAYVADVLRGVSHA